MKVGTIGCGEFYFHVLCFVFCVLCFACSAVEVAVEKDFM